MAKTAERTERRGPTPKEVGKQLRQVRRKQGLSRSDVARSAGLTRRELAAYERGRTEVPDSDLWCLAGSCGVDVTELLPEREPLKVGADLSSLSVGESMKYLRGPAEPDGLLHEYLTMIYELRNLPPGSRVPLREPDLVHLAEALGGTPETIERRLRDLIGASDEEASRLRAMILPPLTLPSASPVAEHDPIADFTARDEAADEFFSMPRASDPFQTPPAPGADMFAAAPPGNDPYSALPPPPDDTTVAGAAPLADPFGADAMAPPITAMAPPTGAMVTDVPPPDVGAPVSPAYDMPPPGAPAHDLPAPAYGTAVHEAPADPFGAGAPAPAPWAGQAAPDMPQVGGEADPLPTLRHDPFARSEPLDVVPPDVSVPEPAVSEATWQPLTAHVEPVHAPAAPQTPYHVPNDVDLTDGGVVHGYDVTHPWATPADTPGDATVFEPLVVDVPDLVEPRQEPVTYHVADPGAPAFAAHDFTAPDLGAPVVPADDGAWGAPPPPTEPEYAVPGSQYGPPPTEPAIDVPAPAPVHATVNGSVAAPAQHQAGGYQAAGADWRVGGIVPATAMADGGGLALHRADARWALADIVAEGDFTLEATFDFRSGAGFGVLFRASADDADRLTAYSLDIDTLAGGCVLRQWEVGTEHWQPLALTNTGNASRMYGRHQVTLSVIDDRLTFEMDGEPVMQLDGLARSSLDHGRAPARGDRVGIQAASTTEVTVESFRLARH